jgi:hypothetical protein
MDVRSYRALQYTVNTTVKQDATGYYQVSDPVREHGMQSPEMTVDLLVDIIVAATREGEGGQCVHGEIVN